MSVFPYQVRRHPQKRKNYKYGNSFKIKMSIFLVLMLIIIAILQSHSASGIEQNPVVYQPTVVRNGDTLWDIATRAGIRNDTGKVVMQIMRYNSLTNSTIYPGQVIYIPVSSSLIKDN